MVKRMPRSRKYKINPGKRIIRTVYDDEIQKLEQQLRETKQKLDDLKEERKRVLCLS